MMIATEKQILPKGWKWIKLKNVCVFKHGGTPNKSNSMFWNGDIPWVSPKDMKLTEIADSEDHITDAALQNKGAVLIPEKSLLAVVRSGILAHSFPIAVTKKRVAFNQDIKGIIVSSDNLDLWYLYWIIKRQEKHILECGIKQGPTVHSIRSGFLESMQIPLPPLPEQKRIAKILNQQLEAVEIARQAAQDQALAVQSLPAAYLREIFESKEAKKWEKTKLEDVCAVNTGTRNPCDKPEEYFKYVDITCVDNKLKKIVAHHTLIGQNAPSRARKVINRNDVIVSTTRPNLNAVALVPPELDNDICSTGFCVLRSKEVILPDFLFAFVQSQKFIDPLSDLVKGALYPAVTDKQVLSQRISLPSLSEQEQIVCKLAEKMSAVKEVMQGCSEQIKEITALPALLLRKAF